MACLCCQAAQRGQYLANNGAARPVVEGTKASQVAQWFYDKQMAENAAKNS